MSAIVREIFTPVPLSASGAIGATGVNTEIAGLFCTTAGTVQLRDDGAANGVIKVNTFNVAAGIFYPLPFAFPNGLYVVLAGGAVITLAKAG